VEINVEEADTAGWWQHLVWQVGRRGRLRNAGNASVSAPPLTFVSWLVGPRKEETWARGSVFPSHNIPFHCFPPLSGPPSTLGQANANSVYKNVTEVFIIPLVYGLYIDEQLCFMSKRDFEYGAYFDCSAGNTFCYTLYSTCLRTRVRNCSCT
jgi:hypothetical protein